MTTPHTPPPWLTGATPEVQASAEAAQQVARESLPQEKDDRGRWLPGVSGNPAGRKKGVPNKRSPLDARIAELAPAIMEKVIEAALGGDLQAASLVLSRCHAPLKARGERLQFNLDATQPLATQSSQVVQAVADGCIAPEEAQLVIGLLSTHAALVQADQLEARLLALEQHATAGNLAALGGVLVVKGLQ